MFISRSAVVAALLTGAVALIPAAAQAAPKKDRSAPKQTHGKQTCKKQKKCQPGKGGQPVQQGRMTGHGHEFNASGFAKVQWEFRNSVCNEERFPDLKVEYGGNTFEVTQYQDELICFTLNPPSTEGNPRAGFDSIRANATGTLNGVEGASITFRFTDAGEPGRADTAVFTITAPDGSQSIAYNGGAIDGGNHQAHRR